MESKTNFVGLEIVSEFLGKAMDDTEESFLNRDLIQQIIGDTLKEEVIDNKQVKQKYAYMHALKVYRLRCRNSDLATRIQSR